MKFIALFTLSLFRPVLSRSVLVPYFICLFTVSHFVQRFSEQRMSAQLDGPRVLPVFSPCGFSSGFSSFVLPPKKHASKWVGDCKCALCLNVDVAVCGHDPV